MPALTVEHPSATPPTKARVVVGWSRRRQALSAAVLVAVLIAAGVFTWRATLSPLHLWTGNAQCSTLPKSDVGQLFGLAISTDLRGVSRITILEIETLAYSGAKKPTYWIVRVSDGSGGTGTANASDPPPNWSERISAIGATLTTASPANLLVELHPHLGHALLTGVRVTYRTPDGLIHTASGNPNAEVDTTGRCSASTGH